MVLTVGYRHVQRRPVAPSAPAQARAAARDDEGPAGASHTGQMDEAEETGPASPAECDRGSASTNLARRSERMVRSSPGSWVSTASRVDVDTFHLPRASEISTWTEKRRRRTRTVDVRREEAGRDGEGVGGGMGRTDAAGSPVRSGRRPWPGG